ncbi:MAG: hypothetical protein ACK4RZ_10920 [Paracoccaceae bacterium]
MSLLGRLRAALGRDDAALLRRARHDVQMGVSLNPPACHAPLNRAIDALERVPNSPEVALLLGRALNAKARIMGGSVARDLRARAVAKLKSQADLPGSSATGQAALWSALAQAWMPLADDIKDPVLCYRQLIHARDAQAMALSVPDASAHLAMADIALALCRNPLCPDPREMARTAHDHALAARGVADEADQAATSDALISAVLHLFPGLSDRASLKGLGQLGNNSTR